MYANEQTYVIAYLVINVLTTAAHERIVLRTIRTNNNCMHSHQISQLEESMLVRNASHLESWHRFVQTVEHLDGQVHC